jgi:protoporphyrinogen/coproporphyrinogen III oxidase
LIAIIGGGITGLAAAYELARQGAAFVLLESASQPGGLIRTERADGFTLDAGPDSLLVQKPAAIQLCEELGLGPRLISTTPPRTAFVLKRGRLHALPSPSVLGLPTSLGAVARYDLLDWTARARLALEPMMPRQDRADESVASFFRRRFGRAAVDLIAEPLLGGIHAGDVEARSMLSLFPWLVEAERMAGGVLRNLAARTPPASGGPFRALRAGMGELVDALVAALPPGSVRAHATVARLEKATASWRVTAAGEVVDAAAVIVTTPAHAAVRLVAPVDDHAARLWSAVPYVSTACVALGWRRSDVAHPLAGSGFVVARRYNRLRITACTWVSSKWEGRAPPDHVLLRAFIGGAHDPRAVDLEDEALAAIAVRDVSTTLDITTPPMLVRVFRARNAGAQHTVGHRERTAELSARLRALPGLFAAGSGFEAIGIPDCIRHGRLTAAAAAEYVRIGA